MEKVEPVFTIEKAREHLESFYEDGILKEDININNVLSLIGTILHKIEEMDKSTHTHEAKLM